MIVKAVFLDRDGVINRRIPGDYVRHPDEFVLLEGVAEAICLFRQVCHLSSLSLTDAGYLTTHFATQSTAWGPRGLWLAAWSGLEGVSPCAKLPHFLVEGGA